MPEWYTLGMSGFGLRGTTFSRHVVVTSDNYELSMVRIEDTVTRPNQPFLWPERRSKGPVLFKHGARSDGYVWLLGIF